jgi:DNA-directed RNA polymerase subunit RPC12/RpoP
MKKKPKPTNYVCGRCGGVIICFYTTNDYLQTAHVFCERCDRAILDKRR